jgi:hypothetical protein
MRQKWDNVSTLGRLYFDNEDVMYCDHEGKMLPAYSLEDVDRNLYDYMKESEILSVKIPGKTAIPYGRYKIELTYSPRFKKILPLLIAVKGFSGVRIHNGSFAKDTDGCILGGFKWHKLFENDGSSQFMISKSKDWMSDFMNMINYRVSKKEEIFIEIVK